MTTRAKAILGIAALLATIWAIPTLAARQPIWSFGVWMAVFLFSVAGLAWFTSGGGISDE